MVIFMNNDERKSYSSPYIIGFLTVLLVVLGIWSGYSYLKSYRYKTQLENTYLRSIYETSTNVSNISSDLVKGLYAGTPTQMALISSKLWKEASSAKAAISVLPMAEMNLENTYRFLSQVGDYAMYLSKKSVSQQKITPEERQQFLALREYSDRLNTEIQSLGQKLSNGDLTISTLTMSQGNSNGGTEAMDNSSNKNYQEQEKNQPAQENSNAINPQSDQNQGKDQQPKQDQTQDNMQKESDKTVSVNLSGTETKQETPEQQAQGDQATGEPGAEQKTEPKSETMPGSEAPPQEDRTGNNEFSAIEKGFTGYPSLIYDGPFSDHMLDKKPLMIQDLPEVTQAQAKEKAAQAAQVTPENFTSVREEESDLPSYVFYNDGMSVAVSKQGGLLSYMVKPKPEGEIQSRISKDDAIAAAQKYLTDLGIKNMKDTYYEITNGLMTINFAHYESGTQVVCYTDLIKVEVNMETGKIMGFDCRGYIINHKSRTFTQPKLSKEEAMKSLSENLTVESVRMALIPTDGKNEVHVYEFLCTGTTGDKVLVYVNADNGVEEQIFILIESDNGVLTK